MVENNTTNDINKAIILWNTIFISNKSTKKYYANLINNTEPTAGEVVFGSAMTGIKGYYATVKLSTDDTTAPGGIKELFAVSSQFVISSQ